ncbi:carotenoid 1,2-hydratase [Rhodocaloribacter litoris]|uniref:lipocalin-like domain-containing protein n=1 Tax=Rhodocaloribacter litoris TaxID=2558931 RepID=UPI00142415F7|nr:lipocalin-like domain-containing protein [Rhodocaloribacter litoris]QXD15464.1 carotenoid 1,2-hydratase [Rhodocaloribacter litoris]
MKHFPFLLIATLAFLAAAGCAGEEASVRATVTVAEAMAADTAGYARATAVRPFVFPEDHGPHPDFKSEWWYVTGNLAAADGRRFGYELTIFRFALAPPDGTARASAWATRQLYMGHFAVTDVAGRRFFPFERFSRGAAGLAGARARPFRVWLEDWYLEADTTQPAPDPALPVMRLRAHEDGTGVDLVLRPLKPIVLQGDRGLDPKGDDPGNASYYYSMTRIATEGTVTVDGATFPVEGLSWMDREWSTSALGPDQVGWDWFALQLSDGRELMFYRLRERDGGISPTSDGVLVAGDGTPRRLDHTDVVVDVLDRWTSPHSGAVYPARWRLRVPREALDLTLTPLLADQEMNVSVRYWEGAVRVEGTAAGSPVEGHGYVELTGYDEAGVTPGG